MSNREAFGRELIRRTAGFEKQESDKWIDWLGSEEADHLLGHATNAVEALLTDREYAVRQKRCGALPVSCDMPAQRPAIRSFPPKAVPAAAFQLPGELPAGIPDELSRCSGGWFGLAAANVDTAGRVQAVKLVQLNHTGCQRQIETMLRLSYATNTSIVSPVSMSDVVLSRAPHDSLCLDEDPPSNDAAVSLLRTGGDVTPPVKIHSVGPQFPASVRREMNTDAQSIVILEAVITKHGCVRSVRPLAQSPFPDLNGEAIYAMSQWKFSPAKLNGKPVDVIYNLTINFTTK